MKTQRVGSTKVLVILTMISVVAALSIYFVIHFGKTMINLRNDINHHSDMSFLNSCISEELREHYKKNERYPENLQLLRESIFKKTYSHKLPEGPNVMDYFNEFKYSTDGNSYSITWEVKHGEITYTHKEEGQKGKLARSKLYINGKLIKRDKE